MYRVMKDDLGKKPYKMLHRHELTEHHKRMRMERSRQILDEIDQGTLPNLVFTDEKKFDIQQVVNQQNDREFGVLLVQLKVGSQQDVSIRNR